MVCRIMADALDRSTATGRRVLDWQDPTVDVLSLRLCGALHRLVLTHADPLLEAVYPPNTTDQESLRTALQNALIRSDDFLCAALDSPPQTNEIARSAMLLPGFLSIARQFELPLRIYEIGSSAGLNLLFDRFHYRYGEAEAGDPTSPVRLAPEVRGSLMPLDAAPIILSRSGSDIAPLDVSDEALRLRLRSFIWADQTARLQRLDAAIGLARQQPFSLACVSAGNFVEQALALRQRDSVFVLFHSIMWQYMPAEERGRIEEMLAMADAPAEAPIARLRMEPLDARQPHATLTLTTWPGGETRHLAHCDYHGRWIEWLGQE